MQEVRSKAKELMKGACRLCPVCDGRACVGEVPGMGSLGTGTSFKNNLTALAHVQLNMRLLHEVKHPATTLKWLGLDLSLPIVASPIGGMFNTNEAMSEPDYVMAVLEGCRSRGIIGCTGDGVPPILFGSGVDGIRSMGGYGIPFIKPWEGAELDEKLERAMATGCPALGMDVDAAGLVTLRKMGRPVAPKSPGELEAVIRKVHAAGIKFIAKGIMTVSDAHKAVDMGADCIVVSNHGGRVLDHTPGTARVLPLIADAVKGKVSIMVDGGVRTGLDVLKMLALGADIVGIGRPFMIAAIGGAADGVGAYIDTIRAGLEQAMILTGCEAVAGVSDEVLFERGRNWQDVPDRI